MVCVASSCILSLKPEKFNWADEMMEMPSSPDTVRRQEFAPPSLLARTLQGMKNPQLESEVLKIRIS
jgi:hypothetical protein